MQSNTFRHLVDTINGSDSVVYVEEGTCGHGVRACFFAVSMAGSRRLLWVHVDMHKSDRDLMGSVGHELRHTVEVLGEPGIKNSTALFMFYFRIGSGSPLTAFETAAAVAAGDAVRAEVKKYEVRLRGN